MINNIKNTSTFTVGCMNEYRKNQNFFSSLYFYKDNPRMINWARIIRTFKQSGGDINYYNQCRVELILELNNTSDILTPDVYKELVDNGFTLDNKPLNHIKYYGKIGAFGSHFNHPLKIDVMDLICRDFNWLNLVDDITIKWFVFGINGCSEDYFYCNLEFKLKPELVKMYLKHDTRGKIMKIWNEIPNKVKDKMNQELVILLNKVKD